MFYDEVICEMEEVQPDNMETTFIISLMCFHLTGIWFRKKFHSENFQENNLVGKFKKKWINCKISYRMNFTSII